MKAEVDMSVVDVTQFSIASEDDYKNAKDAGVTSIVTLVATHSNYKAEGTVEYWWQGHTLFGYFLQYRVTSNGNKKGDLYFGVWGTPGQTWYNKLTGNAVQDGEWHEFRAGGWVGTSAGTGRLYMKYTFDRSNAPDPTADTYLDVAMP